MTAVVSFNNSVPLENFTHVLGFQPLGSHPLCAQLFCPPSDLSVLSFLRMSRVVGNTTYEGPGIPPSRPT